MGFERGEILVFFWVSFLVSFLLEVGRFFRFVGLGGFLGGIVDILHDGWDLWGEWERMWQSGRVGLW